jgi:hypothetical protein
MKKFLLPKARNLTTGQTQKIQDLTGTHLTLAQRDIAQEKADLLAKNLTERTGMEWVGVVQEYVPSQRSSR